MTQPVIRIVWILSVSAADESGFVEDCGASLVSADRDQLVGYLCGLLDASKEAVEHMLTNSLPTAGTGAVDGSQTTFYRITPCDEI